MARRNVFRCLALLLGMASVMSIANDKTVDMTLTIFINVPLPCKIGGGSVEFGNVFINKIDGSNYAEPMGYTLDCRERIRDRLRLQVQGDTTLVNGETVLKTDVDGLGLRIQNKTDKSLVEPGTSQWLRFIYGEDSPPELEVVPVKDNATTLLPSEFNATATVVVDYQ